MTMLGMSYGEKMQLAAAPTGEPGKAPASKRRSARAAVMRPSPSTPIFTFMYEPDVGPVASITSIRFMVIFTGAPDFLDSATASGSR